MNYFFCTHKLSDDCVYQENTGDKYNIPRHTTRKCCITSLCHGIENTQWPNDQSARSRNERFGFESWPGTLCCVLGQDTQLSQCLSLPRSINGYRQIVGET